MIRGENLRKAFDGHPVFENVSFRIPDGKIVGIYGASGIGKSTLAKILCGVLKPDTGAVYLDDDLICSPERKYDRRKGIQIQMVYQQPYASLDHNQKILDGFHELIRYHRFSPTKAAATERIAGLMEEVGLDMEILNHLPHQISGGEAQRIAIARCLLFSPRLLILDEATSMLDVSTQANVIALVKRVMLSSGGSILLISHDKALADYLCDQIYVFDNKTLYSKDRKQHE
ncbi:MAG: ABC transporter ATP-binding protein [Oscillospiraceae bacterium]|nr:ABC transporter ATP-binding protein [Oscillospiraceae bacterium]